MFAGKICEICFDQPKQVVLNCAHAFCEKCIEDWTKKEKACPFCRKDLGSSMKGML